jgi:arginine exporter protein ArgO
MTQLQIPPPDHTSNVPDKATQKGISDFTGPEADNRVLHINLGILKYGTNDKAHAAAVVFSLLLFIAIMGVLIFGSGGEWTKEAFRWLGSAFLFVAGVAIGKGNDAESNKDQKD